MPLPGTRVIPDGWSEHHRPTATATMTADCLITRPSGQGTTGDDGAWTPDPPTTVYTGPIRVVALTTDERLITVGETQQTHRRYQVSIRHDAAEPAVGDTIEILAAVDAGLAGKKLRVIDVTFGSEQWQRDMTADEMMEG